MKTKERYLAAASALFWAGLFILGPKRRTDNSDGSAARKVAEWRKSLPSFLDLGPPTEQFEAFISEQEDEPCRMETCFDFSRCPGDPPYLHYVYPADERAPVSDAYAKMLSVLRSSPHATHDPSQACLFILALDTLDRDRLSEERYVRNLRARVSALEPTWNGGRNHLVFNLYAGTYPDYEDDLGFDTGQAMLAKASASSVSYRPGFDISLPLFHANHPERDGHSGRLDSNAFPGRQDMLLAFKGKRYVYGIGSETRNSLYHLHNSKDMVLVTTCKHGKSWKELQDERCDEDNLEYDKWDYLTLLTNSTFCLVPRGRRLGSFRFIETLQAGCIPVVLSNEWVLPFAEVVDWAQVAVNADERALLQVPEMLKAFSATRTFEMKQNTQVVWNKYFASIQAIMDTTLEVS